MIHSPTHLSNHTPRRKACWMFWGLFSHQRIKILKALHFFWDFAPPQKESRHFILPFCISPHFLYVQPTIWYSFPSQRLSPFQPCSFQTSLPVLPPGSPFCVKSDRFLCRCQQGQHTHEALLDLHFINQKAAFCSLYSHSSFKNFFSSPSPSSLFYFPIYFCLTKSFIFFSCFYFLLLKLPFSYLFSSYFLWILLLPGYHLCCQCQPHLQYS